MLGLDGKKPPNNEREPDNKPSEILAVALSAPPNNHQRYLIG